MRGSHYFGLILFALSVAGCTNLELAATALKKVNNINNESATSQTNTPTPHYKIGNPYEIFGVWYYPERDLNYDETGIASWYGPADAGKPTANGEIFDPELISAAHKTLPLPSVVRITNLENGRSIAVRVNDRGPFVAGRIIDLSEEGARVLGFRDNGIARVRVQLLVEESLRLEREAKNGNFPMLSELEKPEMPSTEPASIPVSVLTLDNGQTIGGGNNSLSAIDIINNSRSANLLENQALSTEIWIQVGAFRSLSNAETVLGRVTDITKGSISSFDDGTDILHRVRLGPLSSVEEADMVLLSVINRGYQGSKIILE
ncbi:MAG: septal ring lytic transglycosylase RlpA family protein [Candidatus Puniceispirillales bacterium]